MTKTIPTQRNRVFAKTTPALLALLLMPQWVMADLVPFGAQWQYLDTGTNAGTSWRNSGFNDNGWASGSGPFGYGDGDESTVVSEGNAPRNRHITTYFRHEFDMQSLPTDPVNLRVHRDDGIVVYLNGAEILRDNMPAGFIGYRTRASSAVHGAAESALQTIAIDPGLLLLGANQLAVEVHQFGPGSPDLSFDLQLTDNPVVRGPYLQQSSSTSITVRWRTESARDAVLRYGTNANNLDQVASDAALSTEHAITLTGLTPDTRYYYSIGDSARDFAVGSDQYFDTHPVVGSTAATRIWVLGDSGTADPNAAAVSRSFAQYNGGTHSDVWLMLGDNAYDDGTDAEYQAAVFDLYPQSLRNSVLWPTLGNHDAFAADSSTQSGPYYDIFTLPTNAESGGVASGTEAYYSFDYANIHFISLDSHDTNRSANGAMATWLENDLAANTQEWIIAYWHHPPYSKGSHDSDIRQRLADMRRNFLPILEAHSVDLVLAGHSHSYERSMLIDGHYGTSDTFSNSNVLDGGDGDPASDGAYTKFAGSNAGSVYSVAGSSGKITPDVALNHPVMISNLVELGSMVIDVQGNQLDAVFLNSDSTVRDSFRIVHQTSTDPNPAPEPVEIGNVTLDSTAATANRWTRINFAPQASGNHTIELTWSGNADIRYTLFRQAGGVTERVGIVNQHSPAQWSGSLDTADQYYLGVWSASGTANVTATLQAESTTPDLGPAIISEGRLDASRATAPRWVRLDFQPQTTGTHTIAVAWENSNAALRFKIKRADGTDVSPTIRGSNPGVWVGTLNANTAYFMGLWSTDGVSDYTATIE